MGDIRKRVRAFEALHYANMQLTSSLELKPVLQKILEQVLLLVIPKDVNIFFFNEDSLQFDAALWAGNIQERPYSEPRKDGITYRVARSGEKIVVPDVNGHPLFVDYQWGGAIIGLPLKIENEVLGVMNVGFDSPHAFTDDEIEVLELFAGQAAVAIRNARMFDAQKKRGNTLEALHKASVALNSSLDSRAVLETIIGQVLKLVDGHEVNIFRYDGATLKFDAALWGGERRDKPFAEPRDGGLTYTVAQTREWIIVPDLKSHPLFTDKDWTGAIIGAPLMNNDEILGVMNISFVESCSFDDELLQTLRLFADQAAIALRNARLFREMERLAATDPLTNVFNRRHFFEVANREFERS
jgi:GAF domain-containing protein